MKMHTSNRNPHAGAERRLVHSTEIDAVAAPPALPEREVLRPQRKPGRRGGRPLFTRSATRAALPRRGGRFDKSETLRGFAIPLKTATTLLHLLFLSIFICGCDRSTHQTTAITLDWKPEPEFGGFYQAQISGAFKNRGLEIELKSAGAGAPTWQLVASGQTEFATAAADEVLIARARGADIVAVFAVYQTSPQGIMVHRSRGFTSLSDVFTHRGVLAAEDATWLKYLLGKFPSPQVTITSYSSGVSVFLAKRDYSQQCFVTSEPLLAVAEGGDPQTFLIADAGYNPYTTVLITRGDNVKNHPQKVKQIVEACREGWRQYLADPAASNAVMGKLNNEMDARTFELAAVAQKPLIETDETRKANLGVMTADRWTELAKQLVDLKVLVMAPPADNCFVDVDRLPGDQ